MPTTQLKMIFVVRLAKLGYAVADPMGEGL